MVFGTALNKRLGLLATACMLSVTLPAAPAWAQKTKNKTPAAEQSVPAAAPEYSVDVPSIEAVGANVDDAILRDIIGGNVTGYAQELADLEADSITIPEITWSFSTTIDDEKQTFSMTAHDLVMSDISEGLATDVSVASMTFDMGDQGSGEFGEFSASEFNIRQMLGFYGLVEVDDPDTLQTIYSDFSFAGGTMDIEGGTCTVGATSAAEFKARPLKTSFDEMMVLFASLEDDDPSPQQIGDLLRMYADIYTAFETAPASFEGFACNGLDSDGQTVDFSFGGITMGAMTPGIYPSIAVDDLHMDIEGEGSFTMGNFTLKPIDLTGPIATIENGPQAMDEAWFMENVRNLIPAMDGFSFSDIDFDVPNPDASSERIVANIGGFDLTLGDYLNGIPTRVENSLTNFTMDMPFASMAPDEAERLQALGLTSIDVGYNFLAAWNEAEDTIELRDFTLTGENLATAALKGTIVNATEALFGADLEAATMAAMSLAVKDLKLDVTDAGLNKLVIAAMAADQGGDPEQMRTVYAGLAQGTIVGVLAGVADAQAIGTAVSDFISGAATKLNIEMSAKNAAGISFPDLMAAETDPMSLLGKIDISATAE